MRAIARRHRRGDADQGERVARSVAHLAVRATSAPTSSGGNSTTVISSPGLQLGLDVRRVAWQAMEGGERNRALAVRTGDVDRGVERGERDAHVGRMGRDAGVGRAEDRVHPGEAVDRVAAAAGCRLLQRAAWS